MIPRNAIILKERWSILKRRIYVNKEAYKTWNKNWTAPGKRSQWKFCILNVAYTYPTWMSKNPRSITSYSNLQNSFFSQCIRVPDITFRVKTLTKLKEKLIANLLNAAIHLPSSEQTTRCYQRTGRYTTIHLSITSLVCSLHFTLKVLVPISMEEIVELR